jgi:hypothetical protein
MEQGKTKSIQRSSAHSAFQLLTPPHNASRPSPRGYGRLRYPPGEQDRRGKWFLWSWSLAWAGVEGWIKSLRSAAAYASFLLSIGIPFSLVLGYMSVILTILPLHVLGPDCSVWRPCTGLSLSDWDQAFTLVCALVITVREVGMKLSGSGGSFHEP